MTIVKDDISIYYHLPGNAGMLRDTDHSQKLRDILLKHVQKIYQNRIIHLMQLVES